MKKLYSIVFVCTGNTCRSPMAEAIARAELARRRVRGVEVRSRGLAASGMMTTDFAVGALAKMGIALERRPSQSLAAQDLEAADLVLAMTSGQKQRAARQWPAWRAKISAISEMSGTGRGDVEDPMGGCERDYDLCAARLKAEIAGMIPKLRRTLAGAARVAPCRAPGRASTKRARPSPGATSGRGARLSAGAKSNRRRPAS